MPVLFAEETSANIREKWSGELRTTMGLYVRNDVFAELVKHPRLVEPAMKIAGGKLYIQQVKVNVKTAFSGEMW